MGIADLRPILGERVDAAYFQDEPTVITKNDKPRAVIVPYAWYERMLAEQDVSDEKPTAPRSDLFSG